jgi:anaerobic dimethyl sulfoxide reductase subunit C (anchor subunit)
MDVREWSLIFFTILTQMAVGSFLALGVAHYYALRKSSLEQADRLSDRALLAIGPVVVLALIASFFHLGNPLNAPRAVTNFGTSWLSREVLFSVVFVLVGGLFAIMQWRKIASPTVRNVIAWIAALIGLALVYSMANVYMLSAQPAWNSWATPVAFFVTTFLLGVFAVGAAFVANYTYVREKDPACAEVQCELLRGSLRGFAIVSLVLLGVEFVTLPFYLTSLGTIAPAAAATAEALISNYGLVLGIRLVLAFLGAGILALFIYQNAMGPGRERILGNQVYLAFGLVLIAEVLGRFLFYATHFKSGI